MREFFKNHCWALALSVLVGLIFLAPQAYFQISLGKDFQGVYREVSGDEGFYMDRAQEIVDGHYFLNNPYYLENKNGLPMQYFLPEFLAAYPAKIFGIGVYPLYEIYDFLLSAIVFFFIYLIFYRLLNHRAWAIMISAAFLLIKYLALFNRPISPQLVFIFALTLIYLVSEILRTAERTKWLIGLAGINFGLLFYSYLYFWSYFTVAIFLLILFLAWQKQFILAKKFLIIFFTGATLAIPYFWMTFQASRVSGFDDLIARLGMIHSHFPSGVNVIVPSGLIMLVFVWDYIRRRRLNTPVSPVWGLMFIGLVTNIIVMNQQILTGRNILFSSHYEMIGNFFITTALVYFLWSFAGIKNILFHPLLIILACIILLGNFMPLFLGTLKFDGNEEAKQQRYAKVFQWLNNNTQKDEVVYAEGQLNSLITSYTYNNVFFNGLGVLYQQNNDEIVERYCLSNYWNADFSEQYIKDSIFSLTGTQYKALGGQARQQNQIRKLLGLPQKDLNAIYYPSATIQTAITVCKKIQGQDWLNNLKKYHVGYLVIDPSVSDIPKAMLQSNILGEKVASINNLEVFRLK